MKNYHTHTYRCKHATGDVVDYVKMAISSDVNVLGISDHTPLPDNRWLDVRMHMNELDGYIRAIEDCQSQFPEIEILKGMECEYSKEYKNFYQEELIGKYHFDYLIFGPHYFPKDGAWVNTYGGVQNAQDLLAYSKYVIESMESGLFIFVAHPDLFGNSYDAWDKNTEACSKDILVAAEKLQIPIEINGLGFRKPQISTSKGNRHQYPLEEFWGLASNYKINVVINSDAHRPIDIIANITQGMEILDRYGLKLADLSFLEKY